jgi:dTDP-4-amino-4,6-dideoxygalactose transaminase
MAGHPSEKSRIPFNRAFDAGTQLENVSRAFASGHLSGDGAFTRACQDWLQARAGCRRALLTTSGTAALEMAALLLDVGAGDEIVVPSFTFVSTANAFVLRGARPVFIDIRPDTFNMDETLLEALITPRTRAIVPVHYAGVGCEMDRIAAVAARAGVPVVEDNAHGLLGTYRGRPLGSFGVLAAQSFHETKNFSCGEGGALLINEPAYIERAEIIREKGTDRSRFFRGQVDKYTWVDVGSSFLPSEILAAVLCSQFESAAVIQDRRRRIWEYYREHLADWADEQGARLPVAPPHCGQPWHLFPLLLPSLEDRQGLIAHLRAAEIVAVFHYVPLHLSEMGRRFGGRPGLCPVTEDVSDRLLRLPLFAGMTDEQLERVVGSVREFRTGQA